MYIERGNQQGQQTLLMDMINNAKMNIGGPLPSDLVNANLQQHHNQPYQPMFKPSSMYNMFCINISYYIYSSFPVDF